MPIYDYECRACGHVVEVVHGVNDIGPSACPQCGGPMRKLLTTPAIVFRGTGWAKKDAQTARAAKADSTAGNGSDKSGDRPEPSGGKPATGGDAKQAPGRQKESAGGTTASD